MIGLTMKPRATACAALVAISLCCSPPPRALGAKLAIQPLELPVPAGSAMPQLSVTGERAIVSWIETAPVENAGSRASLKFAERTAPGWSDARTVASGTDWFVSWADVPSVIRLDDDTLAAHWLQTTDAANEAYDLRLSFSKDGGRTWTPPVSPHHDGTKTQHGFASLFQMPGAGLGLVWLDGRATALDQKNGNDNMSLRAALFDRAGRQVSESLVDDRVCDCCPTAVGMTADGPVTIYRDRSADEIRDIATSRFANGAWTAPAPVHADGWKITACPVNGPAISARGRQVAVAWMTAHGDEGRAFAAFSRDAGATFGAPIRLDDGGSLGRVAVDLADDGSAFASWIEFAEGRGQFRVRQVDPTGQRGPAQTVAGIESDRASGYPRLARRGQELLLAWTESAAGQSRVRTAAARLR
jgi:hypothetical protein